MLATNTKVLHALSAFMEDKRLKQQIKTKERRFNEKYDQMCIFFSVNSMKLLFLSSSKKTNELIHSISTGTITKSRHSYKGSLHCTDPAGYKHLCFHGTLFRGSKSSEITVISDRKASR